MSLAYAADHLSRANPDAKLATLADLGSAAASRQEQPLVVPQLVQT
jgi:hypothetical protein